MINRVQDFFNNLRLQQRFNFFVIFLLLVIFSILGNAIYNIQRREIFNKADNQLQVLLEDLINICEVHTEFKLANIRTSAQLTSDLLKSKGHITLIDTLEADSMLAKDMQTGTSFMVGVWPMRVGGKPIGSIRFEEHLNEAGIENYLVFQRVSQGFVCISTNMQTPQNKSARGIFIGENSPISKAILSEQRFSGRAFLSHDYFMTAFDPIVVDGHVAGMIGVATSAIDYDILRPIFYKKKYFDSGYPYIVSGDGISLLNPNPEIEGKNQSETTFFRLMRTAKENDEEKFRYKWPETESGVWKWTYFKYYEPLDIYVATSIFEYELYSGSATIRNTVLIGSILSIILFFLGITLILKPVTLSIQRLVGIIRIMALGRVVDTIYYKKRDEIGDIINSLNTLIKGLRETAEFAREIEKSNFNSTFTPLSIDDVLGNSLLDMRDSLKKARDEETWRREEDRKRKWVNEGLAKFAEITHQHSNNIEQLADRMMHDLIKYLNANQGGLFILAEDELGNSYFQLISAYAYNSKKYYQKTIHWKEGLVGTCAIEKETIYLTEIPEDYIEIESGLGDANPKSLLIVPLKLEDKVMGVIELASFLEFQEHEIQFVEKLGESIASTISIAKITSRTVLLLEESQRKSGEMRAQEETMRQNLEELRATQEESARREAEMSGVLHALNTSFLVSEIAPDGRILKVNEHFHTLFKLPEKYFQGIKLAEIVDWDNEKYAEYNECWNTVIEGETSQGIELKHIFGANDFWLKHTFTPIFDSEGNVVRILNISVDITENKKQQIKIQQLLRDTERKAGKLEKQEQLNAFNNERLERLQEESLRKGQELQSMLAAIDHIVLRAEYTIDGTILSINEQYIRSLDYEENELKGRNIREFIFEEDLPAFENIWNHVLKGEIYEGEDRRKTKHGREVWLLFSYTPVYDTEGDLSRILFMASDITKQKLNEFRIRERAKKLLDKNKKDRQSSKLIRSLQNELSELNVEVEGLLKALNPTTHLIVYDAAGAIVDATEFALKKIGIAKDQLVGKNLRDFVRIENPEQENAYRRFWDDLNTGQSLNQIKFSMVKNNVVVISETYTPVFDPTGQLERIYKVSNDITHSLNPAELDALMQRFKQNDQSL